MAETVANRLFTVRYSGPGTCGYYEGSVVAPDKETAEAMWDEYASGDKRKSFGWERAKKAAKNYYGGYVAWKDEGFTDKAPGCHDKGFIQTGCASDHIND